MASESTPLIRSKTVLARAELADMLAALATRIREGHLTISQGASTVDMRLPDVLRVETEVKDTTKPDYTTRQIDLEITWRVDQTGRPIGDADPTGSLTIS